MTLENGSNAMPYLTFSLDEEEFALEIPKVHEVLDYTTITKVPRMPEFLRGVLNLRGNVLPVVDLGLKLGIKEVEKTVDTCIIVIEVDMDGEPVQMGILVDSVHEVTELDAAQISPPPRLGTNLKAEFLRGMGHLDEKFLLILDIDKILSSEELAVVQSAGDEMQDGCVPENGPIVGQAESGLEATQ
ncbi:MAG: chemotaxis protein CheW [Acidobacteriota bacterium]